MSRKEANEEVSEKLYTAFNEVVFLKPRRELPKEVCASPQLMRQAFFDGMYEDAPRVLEVFGTDLGEIEREFKGIKGAASQLVTLADYTSIRFPSSKLKVLDSPKINVETRTLACTMATMMGTYILDGLGFTDNFYIRPPSHSVNGVQVDGQEYYVDLRNGAVRKIRRTGRTRDNAGDTAEMVEILDPFDSEYFARAAVACDRSNISLSVIGNFTGILHRKKEGGLDLENGEDEKHKHLKEYFFNMAEKFGDWDLDVFGRYRRFLSPGIVKLEATVRMAKERKRWRRLTQEFDAEKALSNKTAVMLARKMAGDLEVQSIEPTGEGVIERIESDPRYKEYKDSPQMLALVKGLKEKGLDYVKDFA